MVVTWCIGRLVPEYITKEADILFFWAKIFIMNKLEENCFYKVNKLNVFRSIYNYQLLNI